MLRKPLSHSPKLLHAGLVTPYQVSWPLCRNLLVLSSLLSWRVHANVILRGVDLAAVLAPLVDRGQIVHPMLSILLLKDLWVLISSSDVALILDAKVSHSVEVQPAASVEPIAVQLVEYAVDLGLRVLGKTVDALCSTVLEGHDDADHGGLPIRVQAVKVHEGVERPEMATRPAVPGKDVAIHCTRCWLPNGHAVDLQAVEPEHPAVLNLHLGNLEDAVEGVEAPLSISNLLGIRIELNLQDVELILLKAHHMSFRDMIAQGQCCLNWAVGEDRLVEARHQC